MSKAALIIIIIVIIAVIVLIIVIVTTSGGGKKQTTVVVASAPPPGGPVTLPIKACYVAYSTDFNSIPIDQAVLSLLNNGVNLVVLAFWISPVVTADPYSALWRWSQLPQSTRSSIASVARSKNAAIILSAGGGTYTDYPANGAVTFGQGAAQFALNNQLMGVDFDLENFTPSFGTPVSGLNRDQTIQWIVDATSGARTLMGPGAFITHAPQATYFNIEANNGYQIAYPQLAPLTNAFLIQYYNQGAGSFQDYTSIFIDSGPVHPNVAIAQLISALGNSSSTKLVVGKPQWETDASSGYVTATNLGSWVTQASNAIGWRTGVSGWQWHGIAGPSQNQPTSIQWFQTIFP